MEQRASALQQRLEARRNMFMKAEQNTYGRSRPPGPTSLPTFAPPQLPTSVSKNVKDALNILNSSKTNDELDSNRRFSPRFDVGIKDIEKWTNNLLSSRQFSNIVMNFSPKCKYQCMICLHRQLFIYMYI